MPQGDDAGLIPNMTQHFQLLLLQEGTTAVRACFLALHQSPCHQHECSNAEKQACGCGDAALALPENDDPPQHQQASGDVGGGSPASNSADAALPYPQMPH